MKRPALVQADYLWEIHGALTARGIEIPFPQRDLHIRSLVGVDPDGVRSWLANRETDPRLPMPPSSGVP